MPKKSKTKKSLASFEVEEYEYGNLTNREEEGTIFINLKFSNKKNIHLHFEFHDFITNHKRKKTEFYKKFFEARQKVLGWGSRYYDLVDNAEEFEFDFFELFREYLTDNEITYNAYQENLELIKRIKENDKVRKENPPKPLTPEEEAEKKQKQIEWDEYMAEHNEQRESPYEHDRTKLWEIVADATDDMYEALKEHFYPQMEQYQKRYPSLMKDLEDRVLSSLREFEENISDLMPYHSQDFDENFIKWNSEKADTKNEEDVPPSESNS
jgi:hypothetical protein